MYAKILQRLLQRFFAAQGRAPITPMEWSKLRRQAMELARKEGGDPITGARAPITGASAPITDTTIKQPQLPFDTTKDLPGIESLRNNPNIIPFPKGRRTTPAVKALMRKGDVTLGKALKTTPETLKTKKDRHILFRDADEDILRIKRENKEAVERFRKKYEKIKSEEPKTVEDFRDKGDWDPSGMAQGGITRAGFPFGGQALKAIRKAMRANKTWGVGGPPYKPEATSFDIKNLTKRTLGQELDLSDLRKLSKSPFKDNKVTFDQFNREFKNIKAKVLREIMME